MRQIGTTGKSALADVNVSHLHSADLVPSFRGASATSEPGIHGATGILGEMDSGPAPCGASRNDERLDRFATARDDGAACKRAGGHFAGWPNQERHTPPILQTIFHSSAVTGCTERREYFTSAMSASFLSALIAAMVTGFGIGLSALRSTQTNLPVLSVGSG